MPPTGSETGVAAPLSGVRVLDLANEWGILAGNVLADLGADVVAVEPPAGSTARRLGPFRDDSGRAEDSLFWLAYARNKRGISLAIDTPDGLELLLRLVRDADVLIESFAPGWLAGIGLGYDVLAAANPRLIQVSVSPFGQDGPKANWPATDLTVTAASNYLLASGDPDRPPLHVPYHQAYLHAGTEAASGCLVAIRERRRSGLGQLVDVSAQEAMTSCTQSFILSSAWNDVSFFRLPPGPTRVKVGLSGVYPAKDGAVVIGFFFGSGLGPLAVKFMHWVYEEGMCDERDRDKDWVNYMALLNSGEETVEELDRVRGVLERFTSSKTKQELLEGSLSRGLLLSPAFTVKDVIESPQMAHRGYWQRTATGDKSVQYPGPFARFSASPLQYGPPAPSIGEHNAAILGGELGLGQRELEALAARGVV
ncbi:MAG: CoA transferase [Dehalococcoidia bacterium]|nr:CoA transferase [Dehalococcoidia bacterium]